MGQGRDRSVYWRMFSSIPGHYPLHASSNHPVVTTNISPDIPSVPLDYKIIEKPWFIEILLIWKIVLYFKQLYLLIVKPENIENVKRKIKAIYSLIV